MKTPGSVACSCMRMRSPSSAPPENGELGSTAITPTRFPRARNAPTSAEVVVDFPTPGDPVRPITCAVPEVGARSDITSATSGEPSSTHEMRRATARGSPARARATHSETSFTTRPWAREGSEHRPGRRHRTKLRHQCRHHDAGVRERDGAQCERPTYLPDDRGQSLRRWD